MNSTLDAKLKEFFQEQKEYDKYEKDVKKPDLDKLDIRSSEEEVSRIFNQIHMQSRITTQLQTSEDLYHDSIYGKPKAVQDTNSVNDSEKSTENGQRDPFRRIEKRTISQKDGTKDLLSVISRFMMSMKQHSVENKGS